MNIHWDKGAMRYCYRHSSDPTDRRLLVAPPFPGGSLASCLGPLVDANEHVILAKGMNGAETFDYVEGKYSHSVNGALRPYG